MKIGLKIYEPSQIEILNRFESLIDFVEITAGREYDFSFLANVKLPIVLHNEHSKFGVNPANPDIEKENLKSINLSRRIADKYNASKIIVHPEFVENERCSEDQIVKILSNINDERILIENMPCKLNGLQFYGYDKNSLERIAKGCNKKTCLDFDHATAAAVVLSQDPISFAEELIDLKPTHFHIADTNCQTLADHLHLKDGNAPLETFAKMISADDMVTIETDKSDEILVKKDIDFLRENSNCRNILS